jgi:hypothetical protein
MIEAIYKHRNDYIIKNYTEPRFIIMTPQQRAELKRDVNDFSYSVDAVSETFRGILVHVARKEVDMSDWLFYNSAIDIRSEDVRD